MWKLNENKKDYLESYMRAVKKYYEFVIGVYSDVVKFDNPYIKYSIQINKQDKIFTSTLLSLLKNGFYEVEIIEDEENKDYNLIKIRVNQQFI